MVKNSTDFPGDLTLCLKTQREQIQYFRVRQIEEGVTVDGESFFCTIEDLVDNYKRDKGSLPCTLEIAYGRSLSETEVLDLVGEKPPEKFQGKRRKDGGINME